MRKYQPIWDAVKSKGKASLVAPLDMHVRIKQAIMKEKCLDMAFSFLLSEAGRTLELRVSTKGERIDIILIELIKYIPMNMNTSNMNTSNTSMKTIKDLGL